MTDNDIDQYLKESCKSYKGCRVKNSARRSSLQKKTLGIEAERRLAAASRTKEEKMLRDHLRRMKIDQTKNKIVHDMRERDNSRSNALLENEDDMKIPEILRVPVEPYPITMSPRSSPKFQRCKTSIEEEGRFYSNRKGRRLSKEFEDLHINTRTGNLHESANIAKLLLSKSGHLNRPLSRSLVSIKRADSAKLSSRNTSRASLHRLSDETNSSSSAISSLEDLHWIGDPEATKSVRRPRKTVEEQEVASELYKLSKKEGRLKTKKNKITSNR